VDIENLRIYFTKSLLQNKNREEESLPEPLGPEIPPSPPSEPQEVQEPAEVKKGKAVFKVKSTLNQVEPDPIIAE